MYLLFKYQGNDDYSSSGPLHCRLGVADLLASPTTRLLRQTSKVLLQILAREVTLVARRRGSLSLAIIPPGLSRRTDPGRTRRRAIRSLLRSARTLQPLDRRLGRDSIVADSTNIEADVAKIVECAG